MNIDRIRYATAQLVARREGKIYMMQIQGIPTTISMQNGKTLRNLKPGGTNKPVCENIYLLTNQEAEQLLLDEKFKIKESVLNTDDNIQFQKVKEAGPLRSIVKGNAKVAAAPSEEDWLQAAIYKITLPKDSSFFTFHSSLLSINYRGDCARLYADDRLVADNFYYGRPFQYGLWRLPGNTKKLELRILPLQPDAPIYMPEEADKEPGEQVKSINYEIIQ